MDQRFFFVMLNRRLIDDLIGVRLTCPRAIRLRKVPPSTRRAGEVSEAERQSPNLDLPPRQDDGLCHKIRPASSPDP